MRDGCAVPGWARAEVGVVQPLRIKRRQRVKRLQGKRMVVARRRDRETAIQLRIPEAERVANEDFTVGDPRDVVRRMARRVVAAAIIWSLALLAIGFVARYLFLENGGRDIFRLYGGLALFGIGAMVLHFWKIGEAEGDIFGKFAPQFGEETEVQDAARGVHGARQRNRLAGIELRSSSKSCPISSSRK